MLTLNDGRSELWQWDTGRTLAVDADCSQVHFSNKVFGRSIDVDVIDGVAIIPDILLQTDKELNVWAFVGTAENGYTKINKKFKVNRRNKPADYVFTPPDQTSLGEIKEKLDYLESIIPTQVQSDWEQNDSTKPDYVKNRPFYTGDPAETVLFDGAVTIFDGWNDGDLPVEIVAGDEYTVTFNGTVYVLTAQEDIEGTPFIGNPAIWWYNEYADQDNGLPFCIGKNEDYDSGYSSVGVNVDDGDYTLKVVTVVAEVHKIDKKYLPGVAFSMGEVTIINLDQLTVDGETWLDGETKTYSISADEWDKYLRVADLVVNDKALVCVRTGVNPIFYHIGGIITARKVTLTVTGSFSLSCTEFEKKYTYDAENEILTVTYSTRRAAKFS